MKTFIAISRYVRESHRREMWRVQKTQAFIVRSRQDTLWMRTAVCGILKLL